MFMAIVVQGEPADQLFASNDDRSVWGHAVASLAMGDTRKKVAGDAEVSGRAFASRWV
ncbi:hypothetical protein [Xanthomonas hortorum]|uniref:Uncharacterized protein n=1 Tax=Xanthomonas hortorum pv. vitians TaxID=83224 RepID=A0AAW8ZTA5_9XANT|nr:hypothetical protein [Xanthomonas hortorum]MCC8496406.1 hypothetical protein [Xanthomonas hortorum pv. gardneri]MCE4288814.1 hypothetical protein [Xanthomonas hortorum pv. vitians]MCE4302782.1 hypothetical protein [Xanthomonas hortorum pv. vitians]MCE4509897.1 hypothetical protein [Xanthomonas hortorum pv. vitians]MCE4518369.1 hypothetical protein [Xanthomonas hortorum pv. vitians]